MSFHPCSTVTLTQTSSKENENQSYNLASFDQIDQSGLHFSASGRANSPVLLAKLHFCFVHNRVNSFEGINSGQKNQT